MVARTLHSHAEVSVQASRRPRPVSDIVTNLNSELPVSDIGVTAGDAAALPSLARQSVSRFLADVTGMVFAIVSGAVAARGLGPTGKGLFSSLTLLATLVFAICSLGLGDAAVVMVGQNRATIQQAVSVTIGTAFVLSALGAALLWGAALLAFSDNWSDIRSGVVIACAGLPLTLLLYEVGYLLFVRERVAAHSAVVAVTSVTTSLALVLFVGIIPLSIAGAVMANGVGSLVGLVLAGWLLRRTGVSFRPRLDLAYLIPAARYGISVALSSVVTVTLLRADMLLVYALAGPGPAGHYSISLTLAALVGLLPMAIATATFPRLARVDEATAKDLTAQACRYGAAAALTVACALFIAVPFAVPLVFGPDFRPAVVPTLVLLPGGVFWSMQWILSRSAAARGWPGLLLWSFLLALVVMFGMDLFLIPRLGVLGAALSAVAGPAAGLGVCLVWYHRAPVWSMKLGDLVPRIADLRAFVARSLELVPLPRR